jgi:GT2 family glycosyltransferase
VDPVKFTHGTNRIDEQVVVPDADLLVGIPCYKDGPMVDRCLRSLQESRVQLLIVDNNSAPDVKHALDGKGIVIRNDANRYVNPAWNQMMEWFLARIGRYDLLVLANSDLVLDAGWAAKLRAHRETNRKEQIIFGKVGPEHSSLGAFFAMTRRAVEATHPIPDDILIYGGDDFIFEVNRRVGFSESVIEDLTMFHAVSGTISKSPELWEIGHRDNARWHHHVLPKIVPRRVEDFTRCEAKRKG